jgi:hypothetical protein
MKSIVRSDELKLKILALEAKCMQQEEDIKHAAAAALESIKPANLIRNTFNNAVMTPGFGKTLLKGAAGLAAGFVTKKLLLRGTAGIARKTVGTVLELGIAKLVTGNAVKLVSSGIKLFNRRKK